MRNQLPRLVCLLASSAALLASSGCSSSPNVASRAVGMQSGFFGEVTTDGTRFFAGEATESGLRSLAGVGVRSVFVVMTQDELDDLPFDELTLISELGQEYMLVPATTETMDASHVETFAKGLRSADEPILIHGATRARVGALWASYLVNHRNTDPVAAEAIGRSIGMESIDAIETFRRIIAQK